MVINLCNPKNRKYFLYIYICIWTVINITCYHFMHLTDINTVNAIFYVNIPKKYTLKNTFRID